MKFSILIKSILASAALWAATNTAMALTCDYIDGIKPADGFMPLQVSAITVGRDVPLGTEVYRQKFNVAPGRSPTVECKYAPFLMWSEYVVESWRGTTNWSNGTYANKVYRTNIQGLGVAFNASGPLPRMNDKRPTTCDSKSPCPVPFYNMTSYELILIKIGDVSPGVLLGSDLPRVAAYANFNTIRMLGFSMGISGNIQIVSRTCSTPDVVVPMGTHQTKTFTGLNSASGWQDFSIALNNCPAFHGTYSTNSPSWTSQSGGYPSGTGTSGSRTNNSLQYRIDPTRTAINASNGVLSLEPSAAGMPPAASGVGIQVTTRAPLNVPVPLGTYRNSGLNLQNSEGNYSINLRARYLQTGSKVTPGPANASATFTITYQ